MKQGEISLKVKGFPYTHITTLEFFGHSSTPPTKPCPLDGHSGGS